MRTIVGFSTGALALGDFRRGWEIMRGHNLRAIELSALREKELPLLVAAFGDLDLDAFEYVSVHAPSQRHNMTERDLVAQLRHVTERNIPTILHPDVIDDAGLWREFGSLLCLENMDKRKPIGRSATELEKFFNELPDATFCFDIGHARQVDPTMSVATELLESFSNRLRQVHISDVNSSSKHERLNRGAIHAFSKVAHLIFDTTPILLETPIIPEQINSEIAAVQLALPCDMLVEN